MCVNFDRKKLFYALCICRGLNVIAKSYYVNCSELCVYCGSYGLKVIIKTWNIRIHIALRVVYMYIYCGLKVITNLKYSYTYVHIMLCVVHILWFKSSYQNFHTDINIML